MPLQNKKKIVNLGRLNPLALFTQDPMGKSDPDKELQKWVVYQYLTQKKENLAFPSYEGYYYTKTYNKSQPDEVTEIKIVFDGTSHKITLNDTEYQFDLTHNIYYRPSEYRLRLEKLIKHNKLHPIVLSCIDALHWEEYFDRFEIISSEEPLGIGSCGAILKLAGTLAPKPQIQSFELKTQTERVSKIQENNTDDKLEQVHQENNIGKENEIMSHFEYLRAKTAILIGDYYFSEMHQVPGKNVYNFVEDRLLQQQSASTYDAKSTFSDMISIMILMLKSLKVIHDKNYMHLDIKPHNFMIDNAHLTGNFIDFGLSKHKNDISYRTGFTKTYVSPEQKKSYDHSQQGIYRVNVTQKSDIYSLGKSFKKIIKYLNMKTFVPKELTDIINAMCNPLDELRPNVVNVLEEFEKFHLKQKNSPNVSEQLEVLEEAQKTRKEYDQIIAKIRDGVHPSIDEIKIELKKIFSCSLDLLESKLQNSPEFINLYIETIGIKAFANLKSKAEVINQIDKIVNDLQTNIQKLVDIINIKNQLLNNTNAILLSKEIPMFFEAMRTLNKNYNRDIDLDAMVYLNNKYSTYLKKCDQQYTVGASNAPTISHVIYLLATIKENKESPNYLLIQGIKNAIVNYISEHFNEETVEKKIRAASNERITDMYDILKLITDNITASPNEIINKICERMSSFKQGLFTTNQSFFKYFGTSDLKNKIQDTINQFQAQLKPINDEEFTEIRHTSS